MTNRKNSKIKNPEINDKEIIKRLFIRYMTKTL